MSVSRSQAAGVPRAVPRVRPSLRVALAVTVALGLAAGARALWNDHRQAQRNHAEAQLRARYVSAEAAFAKLVSADFATKPCEGGYCGSSKLNPPQVAGQIKKLFPGSKIAESGVERGCFASFDMCESLVEGRFDGFQARVVAFWNTLLLPAGRTRPRGAIEWHSRRFRHKRGSKRLFFLGSGVELSLLEPSGLHPEE
jgi:hypothetical protein